MAGKNKISRAFRILWDDLGTGLGTARNLTGDLVPGSCQGCGLKYDEVDLTGESDAVKSVLAGQADSEITAQFYVNDTAATGAFTVLTGSDGGYGTLTLQWGSNGAAPTTGDPKWEGEFVLLEVSMGNNGGRPVINARWKPQAGQTAPAWGTVA